MLKYTELSAAQRQVVDFLKRGTECYAMKSNTFNYQIMIRPNVITKLGCDDEHDYFNRKTMRALINRSVLVRSYYSDDQIKDRYIVNPIFNDQPKHPNRNSSS